MDVRAVLPALKDKRKVTEAPFGVNEKSRMQRIKHSEKLLQMRSADSFPCLDNRQAHETSEATAAGL